MYKLKLTPSQVECLIHNSHVHGDATKTKAFQALVLKGLYRNTGDEYPNYTQTAKGNAVSAALYTLQINELF